MNMLYSYNLGALVVHNSESILVIYDGHNNIPAYTKVGRGVEEFLGTEVSLVRRENEGNFTVFEYVEVVPEI